jgi:glycosyltransferase involved in cell wall biosynthesis
MRAPMAIGVSGRSTAVRILMLSNLYPPDVEGGAEILAGEIADGLIRQGHDVTILTSVAHHSTLEPQPHIQRRLRLTGAVRVDRQRPLWRQLDLPYRYYRRWRQPANARTLRRVVAETRPDALYVWEITGLGMTSLLNELPTLRLPVVFHLGSYSMLYARSPETDQSRLRARWLKRLLIGTAPADAWTSLIAVSATVKAAYAQVGFDPARIEVIHNGIAPRFFESPSTRPNNQTGPLRLLSVGRLCPEKGILTALKALALLAGSMTTDSRVACQLDVVGDGDPAYQRELLAYVRDQRLAEYVTFHGRVSQDRLIEFYDQSDLLLNTALWAEPFGLTTVEAMARGLPVIGSRVGGTAEIITPGVNGVLTPPGDEGALAAAIQRLAADPTLRARLASAARRTAEERFTIEENVRRVARHLERAVAGDPTNRSNRAILADTDTATDAAYRAETCTAPEGARRAVG